MTSDIPCAMRPSVSVVILSTMIDSGPLQRICANFLPPSFSSPELCVTLIVAVQPLCPGQVKVSSLARAIRPSWQSLLSWLKPISLLSGVIFSTQTSHVCVAGAKGVLRVRCCTVYLLPQVFSPNFYLSRHISLVHLLQFFSNMAQLFYYARRGWHAFVH